MHYKTRELGQRQHLEHSRCSSKFKGMTYTAFPLRAGGNLCSLVKRIGMALDKCLILRVAGIL